MSGRDFLPSPPVARGFIAQKCKRRRRDVALIKAKIYHPPANARRLNEFLSRDCNLRKASAMADYPPREPPRVAECQGDALYERVGRVIANRKLEADATSREAGQLLRIKGPPPFLLGTRVYARSRAVILHFSRGSPCLRNLRRALVCAEGGGEARSGSV